MKHRFFYNSGSKLERVKWKFTKICTPSQLFLNEFYHRCRRAILKNISWWLLLRTNVKVPAWLLVKGSCNHIFILEILTHILHFLLWRHIKEKQILMIFLKFVSAIFYQISIFSSNDSPLKTVKNVFYFI